MRNKLIEGIYEIEKHKEKGQFSEIENSIYQQTKATMTDVLDNIDKEYRKGIFGMKKSIHDKQRIFLASRKNFIDKISPKIFDEFNPARSSKTA